MEQLIAGLIIGLGLGGIGGFFAAVALLAPNSPRGLVHDPAPGSVVRAPFPEPDEHEHMWSHQ